MNRLTLAQALQRECGVSGTLSTTLSQTGSLGRVVNWIDDSWNEIQTMRDDWNWMRSSNALGSGVSFTTVNLQAKYALGVAAGDVGVASTSFGKWHPRTFRCYKTATGTNDEQILSPIDFDDWRDIYMFGARRSVAVRPEVVAIGPANEVCLPPTLSGYTITADYFVAPTAMSADADTPTGLPVRYHMLIVYYAMWKYGGYEAAPEVVQKGQTQFNLLFSTLQDNWLPPLRTAGALA